MEYAYRFRLYPTATQEQMIQKTFGCVRYVYNYFLSERKESYACYGRAPTRFQQDKELTDLKQRTEWLREPDKCALQNAIKDLDMAYQNFFRRVTKGKKSGYPKFKSKRNHRKSYQTNANIKVFEKHVQLPKLGRVRCAISKQVRGRVLSATVSQMPSGKYYVSLCCTDVEIEPLPSTGAIIGIDLGIKDMAITSDGRKIDNEKYSYKSAKRLAKLQRQLSRKPKGSRNWEKARLKVARCQEHIANQRHDNIQKLTTQLIRDYDVICIEDLNVDGMKRGKHQGKATSDVGMYEFRHELEYKAQWYGKTVSIVGRFYPSSQLCHCCGYKNPLVKDRRIREWTCPECGERHDRDINAAKNILSEGMRLLA